MRNLIFTLMMIAGLASAQEYGYFCEHSGATNAITLRAGDTLEVLAHNGKINLNYDWELGLTMPNGYKTTLSSGEQELGRIVCGPCDVSVSFWRNVTYISYKVTRAVDNAVSPANVIVLPADPDGDMQLMFESSDDLLTWNQEFSFTHNSTNQSSKFFRTRLIQK